MLFSNILQSFFGIAEVRIDLERSFKLFFGFAVTPAFDECFAQFMTCHFIVRTKRQSIAVKRDRLFPVPRYRGLFEVLAKGAAAIASLLLLGFLRGHKRVNFLALARDLRFLLFDLLGLLLESLRIACGQK